MLNTIGSWCLRSSTALPLSLLHDRALAPVEKGLLPGSRAGAALPGLKAHPLVPVRGTGAKDQPVLKGPARAATLHDPLTPVGITNRC